MHFVIKNHDKSYMLKRKKCGSKNGVNRNWGDKPKMLLKFFHIFVVLKVVRHCLIAFYDFGKC